jgi:ketosteroid isomerase-like protein
MASTKDVVDHHLKCFGEGDLGGILSDYAPEAVLFTADGALRGINSIRPLFEAMVAEFGKPGATFSLKQQFVEGDHAYILWSAETADNVYKLGTGHVYGVGRQDRGRVIHRQGYAQGLKTRPNSRRPLRKPLDLWSIPVPETQSAFLSACTMKRFP